MVNNKLESCILMDYKLTYFKLGFDTGLTDNSLFYIHGKRLVHRFVCFNNLYRLLLISGLEFEKNGGVVTVNIKSIKGFNKYLDLWYLSYKRKYDYDRKLIEEFFSGK